MEPTRAKERWFNTEHVLVRQPEARPQWDAHVFLLFYPGLVYPNQFSKDANFSFVSATDLGSYVGWGLCHDEWALEENGS